MPVRFQASVVSLSRKSANPPDKRPFLPWFFFQPGTLKIVYPRALSSNGPWTPSHVSLAQYPEICCPELLERDFRISCSFSSFIPCTLCEMNRLRSSVEAPPIAGSYVWLQSEPVPVPEFAARPSMAGYSRRRTVSSTSRRRTSVASADWTLPIAGRPRQCQQQSKRKMHSAAGICSLFQPTLAA